MARAQQFPKIKSSIYDGLLMKTFSINAEENDNVIEFLIKKWLVSPSIPGRLPLSWAAVRLQLLRST